MKPSQFYALLAAVYVAPHCSIWTGVGVGAACLLSGAITLWREKE